MGENLRRECNNLEYRKNEREIYKNCKKGQEMESTIQRGILSEYFYNFSFPSKKGSTKGKEKEKCNANWYVKMDVLCIFILCKEILDNLHPSTEQQAESNIPDLVQTISQSMEYRMVDIDEDAEESFFQDTPSVSPTKRFCSKICARILLNFTDQN